MTTYSRLMEQRQEGFEDGLRQGISQGLQQGSHQKAVETAKAMVVKNIPIDIIADCTGLPQETILKLTH